MSENHSSSNQTIKIVRIAGRLNVGGPARQILVLCRDLESQGFSTSLYFGEIDQGEAEATRAFFEAGLNYKKIPSLQRAIRPFRDLKAFFQILNILRKEKPQILHTHLGKAGALGRLAGKIAGVPVRVHTFHGLNFEGHFSSGMSFFSRTVEKILARSSHALVAVSDSVKKDLLQYEIGNAEKIVVIPPGLDLNPFLQAPVKTGALRKRFRIAEDDFLIGFIGRLAPVKNPEDFLEMAAAVSLLIPNAKFIFLGDGELKGELLREIQSLQIRDRVFFAGWQDQMPACLGDLDLVVSSSLSEGMPLALIEAMAVGIPVVARGVGGIPELIEKSGGGILVDPAQEDGLEKAVVSVLQSPDRGRALGQKGKEYVRSHFTAERLVEDSVNLYRRLLA